MKNLIIEYQKAYQNVVNQLEENLEVLGAFVFGSIITGDLWENSDIDFFVIMKDAEEGIRNVYSEDYGVPVHFKVMSKKEFLNLKGLRIKGSYLHRIFSSSKIVFSRDEEITSKYNGERFYPDMDRRKWTLSYLGKLVKTIDSTEKLLSNNNLYGAFRTVLDSMELYASVYVNSRGYMISKDTLNMAANLDPDFDFHFKKLVSDEDLEGKIVEVNRYLKKTIDAEIQEASEILIAYLKENPGFKSAQEISCSPIFHDFPIEIEGILNLLYTKNLLKRDFRPLKTMERRELIKENVYQI